MNRTPNVQFTKKVPHLLATRMANVNGFFAKNFPLTKKARKKKKSRLFHKILEKDPFTCIKPSARLTAILGSDLYQDKRTSYRQTAFLSMKNGAFYGSVSAQFNSS